MKRIFSSRSSRVSDCASEPFKMLSIRFSIRTDTCAPEPALCSIGAVFGGSGGSSDCKNESAPESLVVSRLMHIAPVKFPRAFLIRSDDERICLPFGAVK